MLTATTDLASAVVLTDVVLVCVGTPGLANGRIDLKHLRQVCTEIGAALRDHPRAPVIVIRSTVPPGTTRNVLIPLLEETSGRKAGVEFGVCFNPEFLREGTAVRDFYNPPQTVVGELNHASGDVVAKLCVSLSGPLVRTDVETAEMVKYVSNTWHALKIGFANEIGRFCKAVHIDGRLVMDTFCRDDKLNISAAYLKPGFAFGGMCLPKDLRALLCEARSHDVALPILDAVLPSNAQQLELGVRAVIDSGNRKVGILGISFKAGTDDLRESPMVELAERLIGKGFDVRIYDRNVNMAKVNGTNRDYVLHRIPHIACLLVESIDAVLEHAEIIVIGNAAPEFATVASRATAGQRVVDFVGVVHERKASCVYAGLNW
jgi:GDP-mannose 6-dehydrogenase